MAWEKHHSAKGDFPNDFDKNDGDTWLMGGRGSGRVASGIAKQTCEHSLPIDIRKIYRVYDPFFFVAGKAFHSKWTYRDVEQSVRIVLGEGAEADDYGNPTGGYPACLYLHYNHWQNSEWCPVVQIVPIEWKPCTKGGSRPWLTCPDCGARCAVVYYPAKASRFRCRLCNRLCYTSQQSNRCDRMMSRALKLRTQLGDKNGGNGSAPPEKPKGMHWSTYDRIVEELEETEHQDLSLMAERLGVLL